MQALCTQSAHAGGWALDTRSRGERHPRADLPENRSSQSSGRQVALTQRGGRRDNPPMPAKVHYRSAVKPTEFCCGRRVGHLAETDDVSKITCERCLAKLPTRGRVVSPRNESPEAPPAMPSRYPGMRIAVQDAQVGDLLLTVARSDYVVALGLTEPWPLVLVVAPATWIRFALDGAAAPMPRLSLKHLSLSSREALRECRLVAANVLPEPAAVRAAVVWRLMTPWTPNATGQNPSL